MKTYNLIYTLSLVILAASILLVVIYPNSGRFHLIAGGLALIGFPLNIAAFIMKKR